jgi:type II secretory ATPase GspE/PulE/Tfp pilus assembly ATPase PilB-like protein
MTLRRNCNRIWPEAAVWAVRWLALEGGMVSLRQDSVRKVVAGLTTPEEILRAVYLEG